MAGPEPVLHCGCWMKRRKTVASKGTWTLLVKSAFVLQRIFRSLFLMKHEVHSRRDTETSAECCKQWQQNESIRWRYIWTCCTVYRRLNTNSSKNKIISKNKKIKRLKIFWNNKWLIFRIRRLLRQMSNVLYVIMFL